MDDLDGGLCVITLLSLIASRLGFRLARRRKPRTVAACVIAVMALLGADFLWLHGRLVEAAVLPVSNLPVVGNWIPLGAGFLAGIILGSDQVPWRRRGLLSAVVFGIGLCALFRVVWRPAQPSSVDTWRDGVCLQSHRSSCSACAAATLLRQHGIASSEREMMTLCLTRTSGTTPQGLYRGLKLKTRGTGLRVQRTGSGVDRLLEENRWPALLLVKLERDAEVDPRYQQEWGWTPGVGHAIVVFGRCGQDRIDVGDPSVGREQWRIRDLRILWQGAGLRLATGE